ncbi:MAG: hypothetical protein JEZ06_08595 [Anaerolineaceae bacterium]|nr:hypothetical protein [Anaerolineaceae bacterium]
MRLRIIGILTTVSLIALIQSACMPAPFDVAENPFEGWEEVHILNIDPIDSTDPESEIIAVYARNDYLFLDIRVDYLRTTQIEDYERILCFSKPNIFLNSETFSIFETNQICQTYIQIQENGQINSNIQSGSEIVHQLDQQLRSEIIRIPFQKNSPIPLNPIITFLTYHPENNNIIDTSIINVQFDSDQQKKIDTLITFWDILPAKTPAQALRHWNGAHSGPLGQRHGLSELLSSSETFEVPIFLLDLKQPKQLAALDQLGQIKTIKTLQEKGLVFFPDTGLGNPLYIDKNLSFNQQISNNFGFQSSQMVFAPLETTDQSDHRILFAHSPNQQGFYNWNGKLLISLPKPIYTSRENRVQTLNLPLNSSDLIEHLILNLFQSAKDQSHNFPLVISENLPYSLWGDSTTSPIIFSYIKSHPWIHVLDINDLIEINPNNYPEFVPSSCDNILCAPNDSGYANFCTESSMVQEITFPVFVSSVQNQYFEFTYDQNYGALFERYKNDLDGLALFNAWSISPYPQNTCYTFEENKYCVLSDQNIFTFYSPSGGRLLFGARVIDGNMIQFTGSSAQLAFGLSDPSDWDLKSDSPKDPGVIPGAFSEKKNTFIEFNSEFPDDYSLVFSNNEVGISKTYQLLPDGLSITYETTKDIETFIPLILKPETIFQPGWDYKLITFNENQFEWKEKQSNTIIQITADQIDSLEWVTFADSSEYMKIANENPNTDFPKGHYLPFPLAILKISDQNGFSFNMIISN